MSKTITSPVGKFPGTVTLPDGLNWDQYVAWEKAIGAAQQERNGDNPTLAGMQQAWLPGIKAVVEAWNLDGIADGNIPPRPRAAVSKLIEWLITEISILYTESDEVPND